MHDCSCLVDRGCACRAGIAAACLCSTCALRAALHRWCGERAGRRLMGRSSGIRAEGCSCERGCRTWSRCRLRWCSFLWYELGLALGLLLSKGLQLRARQALSVSARVLLGHSIFSKNKRTTQRLAALALLSLGASPPPQSLNVFGCVHDRALM